MRQQVGIIANSGGLRRQLLDLATNLAPKAQAAIVVSDDLHFGVSRIYEARLDEIVNTRVFRDYEEAREWLLNPH